MKTTARFELERKRQLKALFKRTRLVELWRKLVRQQMRSFDITDLHDYYDFNAAVEARSDAIIEQVLSGQYRAAPPLIYRVEKKLGVCRHLMVPTPSDALVFQLLTDALYPAIMAAQVSKGAFYARDRHSLAMPHEVKEAESYPWFVLWPKFQKEIWHFSKSHRFLVTSDLANYFDSIGLRELRHVISAIVPAKEVHLDLLFSLIEDLSWKPDYLPTSHKGLPTIHIEAPRLLAHALLFEVDYVLKRRTKNNFVRWMDDINFGAPSRAAASVVLGEISDVLKSRGLALNLSKTEVMTAREARFHFMFQENRRLSRIQLRIRRLKKNGAKKSIAKKIRTELGHHLKSCDARNRDKITKRFLTLLGILGVPIALREAEDIYVTSPSLRVNVLGYLTKLPFSKRVATAFVRLLQRTDAYDDATRFQFVSAIVDWAVPMDKHGIKFVGQIRKELGQFHTPFEWLCRLVLLSKYGKPHEVVNIALAGRKFKDPFFSRQRIAALTRGLGINARTVRNQWRLEASMGYSDSGSVANSLREILRDGFPTKQNRLYLYLFPSNAPARYPLAKFLDLCALAHSEAKQGFILKRLEVTAHVRDPWYLHWLKKIHPAWF